MHLPMLLVRPNDTDIVALLTAFSGEDPLDSVLRACHKRVAYIGWGDDNSTRLESPISLLRILRYVWHVAWLRNDAGAHGVDGLNEYAE
jgi:hypothetical protein